MSKNRKQNECYNKLRDLISKKKSSKSAQSRWALWCIFFSSDANSIPGKNSMVLGRQIIHRVSLFGPTIVWSIAHKGAKDFPYKEPEQG